MDRMTRMLLETDPEIIRELFVIMFCQYEGWELLDGNNSHEYDIFTEEDSDAINDLPWLWFVNTTKEKRKIFIEFLCKEYAGA